MRTANGRVGTARRAIVVGALHTSASAVLHESASSIVKRHAMIAWGAVEPGGSPGANIYVCV